MNDYDKTMQHSNRDNHFPNKLLPQFHEQVKQTDFTLANFANNESDTNIFDINKSDDNDQNDILNNKIKNAIKIDDSKISQIFQNPFDDNSSPSIYVETSLGNFEKQSTLIQNQNYDKIFDSCNNGKIYVKPKPLLKEKSDLSGTLIKIKIDREIYKAQFNALSKMIDLKDFKRLKPRAPKDLLQRIYNPVSVERKPFVVKKWTSPYKQLKEKQ